MVQPFGKPFGKRRSYIRLFSVLAALLLIVGLLQAPLFPALTVRDAESGRLLWHTPVTDGTTFGLRWIHSIHRSPVIERYRVSGSDLILTELSFQDYGVGMETGLAPGEQIVIEDGTFTVVGMNRTFSALPIFIGQVRANHTLLFSGEEIPLRTLNPPGTSVTIRVEKRSIIEQIGGER